MFFAAHHAAVEQRQRRHAHHQHERGGDQHPRGVALVGRGRGRGGCGRRSGSGAPAPRQPASQARRRELQRGAACRRCAAAAGAGRPVLVLRDAGAANGERAATARVRIKRFIHVCSPYSASAPVSPVRMRTTCSRSKTKILPSPILPVLAALLDRLDDAVEHVVLDRGLDLHLRQEVDDVLGAAIELGVALLPAEALDLGDGDALHADRREGLAHLVELERLDDGGNEFHGFPCERPRNAVRRPRARQNVFLT